MSKSYAEELLEKEIFRLGEQISADAHGLGFSQSAVDEAKRRLKPLEDKLEQEKTDLAKKRRKVADMQAELLVAQRAREEREKAKAQREAEFGIGVG